MCITTDEPVTVDGSSGKGDFTREPFALATLEPDHDKDQDQNAASKAIASLTDPTNPDRKGPYNNRGDILFSDDSLQPPVLTAEVDYSGLITETTWEPMAGADFYYIFIINIETGEYVWVSELEAWDPALAGTVFPTRHTSYNILRENERLFVVSAAYAHEGNYTEIKVGIPSNVIAPPKEDGLTRDDGE
ncbi:MAG: hypothetical protein LBS11_03780 [Oscillospiraceae bacterium]|jgi:hypothetical protein|nr:hypothetical protein [Oscillospiraceae bacterium]